MSAFTEFVLVAIALYLWESTLWLPLRGIVLRRKWFGGGWKALDPRGVMAGKELGLIPLFPLPPDSGIAPCQGPPLVATGGGGFLLELAAGGFVRFNSLEWSDLVEKDHYLVVAGTRTRTSSPRFVDLLRRAKNRGATPAAAVGQAWRFALSPTRTAREWQRWRRVSSSLRILAPVLAIGTFAGLPLSYIYLGILPMLILLLWLWVIMASIAAHLWWLGARVYPSARPALRMDAILSLVVPFHAMRAVEIASLHAMGTTHPAGLMLSTGDTENPWLRVFVRKILHPLPDSPEDAAFAAAVKPFLTPALAARGKQLADYDRAPDHSEDPDTTAFCPRCHARYLPDVKACPDCSGIPLRSFDSTPA